MNYTETVEIFKKVVAAEVGTVREINDGGTEVGNEFTLEAGMVDGVAENLATWWCEKFEDTDATPEFAADYLEEVYPVV